MSTMKYENQGISLSQECAAKYGPALLAELAACFQALPLCALVTAGFGRLLCCHGGLSPKLARLADIGALNRQREVPLTGALCDLLWSDPLAPGLADSLSDKDYAE